MVNGKPFNTTLESTDKLKEFPYEYNITSKNLSFPSLPGQFSLTHSFNLKFTSKDFPKTGRYRIKIEVYYGNGEIASTYAYINITQDQYPIVRNDVAVASVPPIGIYYSDTATSPEIAAFSGIWTGIWKGKTGEAPLPAIIAVTKVSKNGEAELQYWHRDKFSSKYVRDNGKVGRIVNESLYYGSLRMTVDHENHDKALAEMYGTENGVVYGTAETSTYFQGEFTKEY